MNLQNKNSQPIIPPKSPNDQRQYQAIILQNQIKVLLIHDSKLQKSACSISVGVGSLEDPQQSLGLAHFLQHMLFMGSQNFPSHNQYSSFINLNSGMDNAYTSDEETNYFFQVANKAFPQAMQRLCDFFKSALLNETCINKQRQAVHQQYILWTNDDNCRKWQILHKLGNQPFKFFSIGNNETLGHEKVRSDLVQFYKKNYSGNIINAVLCSSMPISQIKKQVLKHISSIQNKNISKFEYKQAYSKQQLGKLINMQSIKDQAIMECFFVLSHLRYKYKKHVGDYITHVLGHQGKNSLLSYLKSKQYASSITSYQHDLMNQTIIGLQIKLTQQGSENYQEIYNIVMDFTGSLKAEKYIYEQIQQKNRIQFQFKQKTQTYRYVCDLSSKMHNIPLVEILNYKSIFQQFDQKQINTYLSQLNPFNVIIVFSNSQELQNPIIEKYLGAKYLVSDLPIRKSSGHKFMGFEKNAFIPLSTQLIPKDQQNTPKKIKNNVYFLKDNQFNVCKGGVRLVVYGPQKNAFLQLYSEYLQYIWKNISYDAEILNTKIEFQQKQKLILQFFGFNDTVMKLIKKIGQCLQKSHYYQQNSKLFDIAKEDYLQNLNNFYSEQVDQIADHMRQIITKQGKISIQQTIKDAETFQFKQFTERAINFWKRATLEWVVVGNFTQNEALKMVQQFQTTIGSKQQEKAQLNKVGCIKFKQEEIKHQILMQEQEIKTSCCIVSYQVGQYNKKISYILELLKNHIQQPFFNQLRTQKQLAYYLAPRKSNTRGILGLNFLLVSSTIDAQKISQEIQKFVKDFFSPQKLKSALTPQKFDQIKQSVRVQTITPHNNLHKLFEFVSTQINNRTFYFNRKQKEEVNKYLDSITVDNLIQVANSLLQKSIQFLVTSKNHQQEYMKRRPKCLTFDEIKKNAEYFEDHISDMNFVFKQ